MTLHYSEKKGKDALKMVEELKKEIDALKKYIDERIDKEIEFHECRHHDKDYQ